MNPQPDVEGTVEPGILSASWAPDELLLALVTGVARRHSNALKIHIF